MEALKNIQTNEFQTKITDELLQNIPEEVLEQLYDILCNILFILNLISPNRPRAKDLPRDEKGRIIINLTNPHIIEDSDYFRLSAIHFMKHGCYTFLKPNSNPNSEYRKHWDEEIRRCLEGYVRESDGEWVTGICYWYLNYCPMMVNMILEGKKKAIRKESMPFFFEGCYWRFHYLNQAREKGHHAIELAKRGAAHPYSEYVYTPEGKKSWSDIKVGDKLFNEFGEITLVTNIPFDDICDIYELTLRDGRKVKASSNHLWSIDFHNRKNRQLMTTLELYNSYKRNRLISKRNPTGVEYVCSIPRNNGVEFPYKETKVDPYTFGLLLGDGCFRHTCCYYTCSDSDFKVIKNIIPYKYTKWSSKYAYNLHINNWRNILKEYNLYNKKSKDKFIPDEYKFNSKIVRLNILKGLIDSDGFLGKHDIYQITITSKQLADDILFIARSLGYNSSCNKIKAGYKKDNVYIKCNDAYRVTIHTLDSLSNLPRKQANIKIHNGYTVNKIERTRIIDIKYIGKEKAKCVTVDNNTGLYLINDFILTHNSKSYSLAAIMSHNMILGESFESRRRTITVLTAYQKEYLKDDKDGTLSKFRPEINFIFNNTPFPHLMLKNSPNDMTWQMGYKDEFNREKGSLNMVMAVSAKDDSEKLRGKRGWILYEEMGSFKGLLSLYDITRKSVEDGDYTFAILYLVGTAAEDESDFSSAKTLLYSPKGYNIYDLENVYDKKNQGKPTFGFFFPSYINRAGCYNKDGVSDVIKALIEILMFRYKIKYNSTDPKSVLRAIAEDPITPAEAIIKVKAAYFPVQALTERLLLIDSNPNFYDGTYIGLLVQHGDKVEFKPTSDIPIRNYGVENDTPGAVEIFNMPEKDSNNKIPYNRYIIGHDPVDNDTAESNSLSSTIVLDLWTDNIVAEYTGRQQFAEDNYEIVRLLCLFYNAKCLYEAHPYDLIIRLPDGTTKLWGDIKIGDEIFTVNNKTTKVMDIPVDGEDDIYRITLQDGRTIESSKGHIWEVELLNHKGKYLITTELMFKKGVLNKHKLSNFFIPQSGLVSYEHKDVPIDPYTMGLLIAEGAFTKFKKQELHNKQRRIVQFSSSLKDAAFYKNVIPYPMKYIGTKGFTYHLYIDNIYYKLKELGLLHKRSEDKFIPSIYLYNDYNTRLELLKGLMDGDGCAVKKGASIYITTSKLLKEDIMLLCRSLGFKAIELTPKKEEYITSPTNNKKYLTRQSYRVAIATNVSIFKLPRKINKLHIYSPSSKGSKASAILYKTPIINIEYVGKKKCKCITVEDPSELYLIGDYVVTHNCNKKGLYAYFAKLNCTHLLADTPEYLRDKLIIKYSSFGSNAHPYNQLVRTPNGIKEWGDIQIGDYLYSIDGNTTKVIDIPIDEELDIYRITLRDGRTIEASEGHIWEVWKGSSKLKRKYLKTTKEIQNDIAYIRGNSFESKYYIRNAGAVYYKEQNIPMNPYLLGLMLGDGTMANKYTSGGNKLYFTSNIDDMKFYGKLLNLSYRTTDNRHHVIDYSNWGVIVKLLGLAYKNSHTKFIPDIYKYNTYNIRLNILQGLLDTDGTCSKNGCPTYCTVSNRLAEDVLEVARSLGINCNKRIYYNKYGPIYYIIFYTNIPIFKLPRKLNRQQNIKIRTRDFFIGITNIEYIGKKKAKCVTVDRLDGLYLIGDFVITHNCKGVNASAAINNYANGLIRDWLLKPVTMIVEENNEVKELTVLNLFNIKNRALIEELIAFNPEVNVDRIRALGMVMLYREEQLIAYNGDFSSAKDLNPNDYLGNDDFFNSYDKKISKFSLNNNIQ